VLAPDRHRITQVLTGGTRGADALGKRWAWSKQVPWKGFKADWERFGKSAGVRCNYQMAQAGDVLVAFWDGQSPGTSHLIQCMRHQAPAVPQGTPALHTASGEKAKARAILAAIRMLQVIEQAQRPTTPDERQVLIGFPGFCQLVAPAS